MNAALNCGNSCSKTCRSCKKRLSNSLSLKRHVSQPRPQDHFLAFRYGNKIKKLKNGLGDKVAYKHQFKFDKTRSRTIKFRASGYTGIEILVNFTLCSKTC